MAVDSLNPLKTRKSFRLCASGKSTPETRIRLNPLKTRKSFRQLQTHSKVSSDTPVLIL